MQIQKILVATDFSPESSRAAAHAVHIARHTGAEIVFVHASSIPRDESTATPDKLRDQRLANRLLGEQASAYAGTGVPVSHRLVSLYPETGIPAVARRLGADMVVLGTHGRTGLKRLLLGSVAESVVRRADNGVFVARGLADTEPGYRRILVPTDFSAAADRALDTALTMLAPGGRMVLFHVWHLPGEVAGYRGSISTSAPLRDPICRGFVANAIELANERMERYRQQHQQIEFRYREGSTAGRILSQLESHHFDLVVMGSHGRDGLARWVLGSVAETTVRHAPCSVLVVHAGRAVDSCADTSHLEAKVERRDNDCSPPH